MLKIDIALVQILNTQLNTVTIKQNKGLVVQRLKIIAACYPFNLCRVSLKTTKIGTKQKFKRRNVVVYLLDYTTF